MEFYLFTFDVPPQNPSWVFSRPEKKNDTNSIPSIQNICKAKYFGTSIVLAYGLGVMGPLTGTLLPFMGTLPPPTVTLVES